MEQFTKIINFIMELIEMIKRLFNKSDNADQPDDDTPAEVPQLIQ